MSKPKARMHNVAVTATKDGAGKVSFQPRSELWNEGDSKFHFHKDRHGMNKEDYHLVEYVLDDRTGDRLRFPEVPDHAMWVAKVDENSTPTCPDKDTESDYSVLEPICVCDDGQRLIVRNANPRQEQWVFTMNFVKNGERDDDLDNYVNWDPINQNHNGGA